MRKYVRTRRSPDRPARSSPPDSASADRDAPALEQPATRANGINHRLDQVAIYPSTGQPEAERESAPADLDTRLRQAIADPNGSEPLEPAARTPLEAHLGHSFAQVRVHADGEADQLARAINATAFTAGKDIFFRAGAYDPQSTAGQHLLAHEAAHVRQQAQGSVPASGSTDGLALADAAGDVEQAAHRSADAFLAGTDSRAGTTLASDGPTVSRSSGTPLVIQREAAPSGPAAYVGAGTDEKQRTMTYLPNREGGTVALGEAGFSRAMLQATPQAADDLASLKVTQSLLLHTVLPDFTGLEKGKKQRGEDVARMKRVMEAPWYEENHFTRELAREGKEWAESHLQQITQDGDLEDQKFKSFNNWVPQANGFYSSLTRLQAQMNMLGITDPNEMVTALTKGLGAASTPEGARASGAGAVAERYLNAQTGNDRTDQAGRAASGPRPTSPLPIPPVDDTATEAALVANQSFSVMNTSYLDLQRNFHDQKREEINHEGDAARTRMQQINDVKQFIGNVGKTIDLAASVVNSAPATIANATTFVQRTGAQVGALRNRRATLRGEAARWNPTYTTVNAEGKLVVRNMQTGMDLDPTIAPGKEGRQTPSPDASGGDDFTIPTSIGGALSTIADFAYAEEVRDLKQVLDAIEARCTAEDVASAFLETTKRVRAYRDALMDYALKANHLQQRLAERRRQYLEFGEQLDSFARNDPSSRLAGEAPAKGGRGKPAGERYATIMVLTGQVREALVLGRAALTSDNVDNDNGIRAWANGIRDRRTAYGLSGGGAQSTIDWLRWPANEQRQIEELFNQVSAFRSRATMLINLFGPIDVAADNLIKGLHPGGGGSGAY